ncbi:MAG: O-antigen ligase family protein [Candidatus Magasanikbacteria bacterium]|jgi:O-antigen ligase|nr:O-antigen ligase family protein [Candidatus Magasanikbacteria bacterium]
MNKLVRVLCFSLFLLLPTYLVRFSVGGIPTTVLEILVLVFVAASAWHYAHTRTSPLPLLRNLRTNSPLLFWGTALFLAGATISIFTAVDIRAAAGAWKAFFIEPVFFAIILLDLGRKKIINPYKHIIVPLLACAAATAVYALYQYMHPELIPAGFFVNEYTFRTTAWYGFPNGVGIFLGSTFAFIFSVLAMRMKRMQEQGLQHAPLFLLQSLLLVLFIFAILTARSTGALVGIAAIMMTSLIMQKKFRKKSIGFIIVGILFVLLLPPTHEFRQELLAQDRSGQIRRAMWSESIELIKDRPLLGAGLASYDERIAPYHTTVNGEGIEIFHHPHNLVLTMWTHIGLLGLIGFVLIALSALQHAYKLVKTIGYHESYRRAFEAFVAIMVMGLVDSPYIKNDWAIVFWAVVAILFMTIPKKIVSTKK